MKAFLQAGQLVHDHLLHAGILQTDGVQHPGRAFSDARRRVAEAGLEGRSLKGKGAKAVDIIELGKLIAEAEGAGGGNDRVIQLDPAEVNAQSSHRISSFSKTGPSLQMRL